MSNLDHLATLIATQLRNGITHPGDDTQPPHTIHLPAFRTTGMPPQLAEHVNTTTQHFAQAILHAITQAGYRITNTPEPDNDPTTPTTLTCRRCNTPLATFTRTTIDGGQLITHLHNKAVQCPHN